MEQAIRRIRRSRRRSQGSIPSRAALALLLAVLMNCGENYTYFVDQTAFNTMRAENQAASGVEPILVPAVREQDRAKVWIVAGTFRRGDQEPAPPPNQMRVGRLGSRHPLATAGFITIGVGVAVDIVGTALALVGLNRSVGITEGHQSDALLGPGIILGLVGNLTWLVGIPIAAAGAARHVEEITTVPRQVPYDGVIDRPH